MIAPLRTTGALAATIAVTAGASAQAQAPASPPVPAPTAPAPPPDPQPPARVRLSDETTTTRWAHAVTRAVAYSKPSAAARPAGRLRLLTEDGFPEVYLALVRRQPPGGAAWIRVRLPQRPNAVTGWVRRGALSEFHRVHTQLVVDRARMRITLFERGRVRFRAPVGIGAPPTPTPSGRFWIRERFHVHGNPLYGTRAMGTAAYSDALTDWPGGGVIGVHGTAEPGLIPGRPSHGCIRLRNADMERLYRRTPIGTPLRIL